MRPCSANGDMGLEQGLGIFRSAHTTRWLDDLTNVPQLFSDSPMTMRMPRPDSTSGGGGSGTCGSDANAPGSVTSMRMKSGPRLMPTSTHSRSAPPSTCVQAFVTSSLTTCCASGTTGGPVASHQATAARACFGALSLRRSLVAPMSVTASVRMSMGNHRLCPVALFVACTKDCTQMSLGSHLSQCQRTATLSERSAGQSPHRLGMCCVCRRVRFRGDRTAERLNER